MGKKRKLDHDSSSSDAKRRCRSCHCHNGDASRRSDDGFSLRDAVNELKDVIQVKTRTKEKFKRKIEKLMEKRKKDKNKHEEDLRMLKEDLIRIFKEDHQELKLQIQEMRKEGCAEVNHHEASPFQRFNESKPTPVSWSKEEFEKNIVQPREGIRRLVENGTFDLIDGSCAHEGAIIMDNSQQREVKLGVMIAMPTETRVLEGVSNPFKVQEGKTKKTEPNKKCKKSSPPVPTGNLVAPTSTNTTQHGQGPVSTDVQHCFPPPVIQDVLQKAVSLPRNFQDHGNNTEFLTDGSPEDNRPATVPLMVEGNGQPLNGNGQQSCKQIRTQISWLPTSTHSMQHGQDCSLPSTSIQNPLQAAGYCPVNQSLLACEQDQYTSSLDASSQLAFLDLSAYASLNDIYQWTSTPSELGLPSQSIGEISIEDVPNFNVRTQIQDTYVDASFRCNQVLLQWDEPHVEDKKHWNFLDQLMPLYSTQSGFYRENFPSTSLMDKAHKLLASISSGDYGLKMITSVTNRATQTPQRRGVLICPIEPYDSDDKPPVKKQRNAKYQLRFVNRVCSDYYTREQIKSEDGNILKVALYDENNLVVTSGPLSSASVEVVLLHGDFNAEGQDYWTSEEFSACLVHPQSVKEPPALGGDRVLALTDGEAELGNAYFQSSSFHARTGKFKMGVEIKSVREESVQEGITSPFLVRVCQGEESSSHQTTSFKWLGVRIARNYHNCGTSCKKPPDQAGLIHQEDKVRVVSPESIDLRSKEERTTMQGAPADSLGAAKAAARSSRYELQKRLDWNTFRQFLRNHRPPLELSRCSGAHVLEFLRYLDQFGMTKVHAAGCHSFGHPSPLAPCPCPLRQAWGSLNRLVGRLRAAFEEHGGRPEANPFRARDVRLYLREVRDSHHKARGIRMPAGEPDPLTCTNEVTKIQ